MHRTAKILVAILVAASLVSLVLWFLRESGAPARAGDEKPPVRDGEVHAAELGDREEVSRSLEAVSEEAAEPSPPQETEGALVFGTVFDPDRSVIVDARVTLRRQPPMLRDLDVEMRNGSYSAPGLESGLWQVSVTAPGYCPLVGDLEIPADPARQRYDFILQPARVLEVFVRTPDGKSFLEMLGDEPAFLSRRGLAVIARAEPFPDQLPMNPWASHFTTSLGRFHWRDDDSIKGIQGLSLPLEAEGVLEVEAELPVYVGVLFKHVVLASAVAARDARDVHLVVPADGPARVRSDVTIRLVDRETGAPVKAQVALTDRQRSGGRQSSDDSGVVTFESVPPGLLELEVYTEDHEVVHRYLSVEAGRPVETVLRVGPGIKIRGRIETADGRPVTEGGVSLRNLDQVMSEPQPLDVGHSYSLNARGEFEIEGVAIGRSLLFAGEGSRGWALNPTVVDTQDLDGKDVVARLHQGTAVSLRPEVDREEQYLFRILDEGGVPVWVELVRGPWVRELSLRPGRYTLETFFDRERLRETTFTVGDMPLALAVNPRDEVPLEPVVPRALPERSIVPGGVRSSDPDDAETFVIEGRVHDADGRPVRPSTVLLRGDGNVSVRCSLSGSRFSAPGMSPGSYSLEVRAERYKPFQEAVEITNHSPPLEVTVEPALCFDLWFTTPDGRLLLEAADRDTQQRLFGSRAMVIVAIGPAQAGQRQDPEVAEVAGQSGWPGFHERYRVEVYRELPVCVTLLCENQVVATHWVEQPTDEVIIPISLSSLLSQSCHVHLRVVDGATEALLQPTMVVLTPRGWFPGVRPTDHEIGADGTIRLRDQPPGRQTLHIHQEGYAWFRKDLELTPSETHDLGTVRLHPKRSIGGLVVDEHGNPVQCRLAFRTREDVDGLEKWVNATTKSDGSFHLELGGGRYLLVVNEEGRPYQLVEVDLIDASVADLEVVLDPGTPVTFELAAGVAERTRISIEWNGTSFFGRSLEPGETFEARFVPGSYVLKTLNGAEVLRSDSLDIGTSSQRVIVSR